MDSFEGFGFVEPIVRALQEEKHTKPTPVQAQAVPAIIEGKDVIGIAQTGTGKTAAFVLPILQRLAKEPMRMPKGTPRALVLVPTRELSAQVAAAFRTYGKHMQLGIVMLYGGVPQEQQVHELNRHTDVIIATPGRLIDLVRQRVVHLNAVEVLVLDEADRMLDLGFAEDLRLLAQELPQKQRLLFSATMPFEVEALAQRYLRNPFIVRVTAQATTASKIKQVVLYVDREDKFLLLKSLLAVPNAKRVLVFTQMKHMVDKITMKLVAAGVKAEAMHSDRTQTQRAQAIDNFRSGSTRVLVATDIAARGIDIEEVSHVINYDLPKQTEVYVHRIGRTGRAGAEGTALTFCSAAEREQLKAIELLIGKKLTVREHKYHSADAQNGGRMAPVKKPETKPSGRKGRKPLSRSSGRWKQR